MPENLNNKRLALFFTFRASLKTWHDTGIISREVALYNRLSAHFKQIYFFTYGGKEDLKLKDFLTENITIVPIPFLRTSRAHTTPPLIIFLYSIFIPLIHYRILKKVDILKTNQMKGSWAAVLTKIVFRSKLIVRTGYVWSFSADKKNLPSLKQKLISLIERLAYAFSDRTIVTSEEILTRIQQTHDVKGRVTVIPNSVDTDLFKPVNGEKRESSICFVGRLSSEKNLFSLLEAATDLPCTLTLVGSGDQKDTLVSYAREKGMHADFPGTIPNSELPRILNQHEVFVLPSLYEGMPKALLEAMSCGLPCIGTDVEGIRDILVHKENGYLCGTDAKSLREAITEMMNDHVLREKTGRNARKTVMNTFSLEKVVNDEIFIYEKL